MDVWVDGQIVETFGEFVEGGSEHHFEVDSRVCVIRTLSTGDRRRGVEHILDVDGMTVQPSNDG